LDNHDQRQAGGDDHGGGVLSRSRCGSGRSGWRRSNCQRSRHGFGVTCR